MRTPYINDDERAADVVGLIFGSYDTTGNTLGWILVMLASHPEVQSKLQAELDQANPSRGQWSSGQLPMLKYLSDVIRETIRLWPVFPILSYRVSEQDIDFEGLSIPEGSQIVVHGYAMSRLGISKPDDFIPERWAEDNADTAHLSKSYMPFGSGLRQCVGMNLANLQLRMVIATVIQHFTFELASEVRSAYVLILKPDNVLLKVKRRK